MSFTRNYQYPGSTKQRDEPFFREEIRKIKDVDNVKPKYYTNYQDYE
jgi:hypothetical protein